MYRPLSVEVLLSNKKCCNNGCKNCPYKNNPMKEKIVDENLIKAYNYLVENDYPEFENKFKEILPKEYVLEKEFTEETIKLANYILKNKHIYV
jgi:hypothetical protein